MFLVTCCGSSWNSVEPLRKNDCGLSKLLVNRACRKMYVENVAGEVYKLAWGSLKKTCRSPKKDCGPSKNPVGHFKKTCWSPRKSLCNKKSVGHFFKKTYWTPRKSLWYQKNLWITKKLADQQRKASWSSFFKKNLLATKTGLRRSPKVAYGHFIRTTEEKLYFEGSSPWKVRQVFSQTCREDPFESENRAQRSKVKLIRGPRSLSMVAATSLLRVFFPQQLFLGRWRWRSLFDLVQNLEPVTSTEEEYCEPLIFEKRGVTIRKRERESGVAGLFDLLQNQKPAASTILCEWAFFWALQSSML